jgi:hypothetical protein
VPLKTVAANKELERRDPDMTKIRRFGVLSVGLLLAVIYALLGLIFGAIVSLIALAGAGPSRQGPDAIFFGAGAVLITPILYGIMGFIGGVIAAGLYNLVARITGGIEVETSRSQE